MLICNSRIIVIIISSSSSIICCINFHVRIVTVSYYYVSYYCSLFNYNVYKSYLFHVNQQRPPFRNRTAAKGKLAYVNVH